MVALSREGPACGRDVRATGAVLSLNIMEDAVSGAAEVQGLDDDILEQLEGDLEYVK